MDSGDNISYGDFPHLNCRHSNHSADEVQCYLPHGDELPGCHGSGDHVWGRNTAPPAPCLFHVIILKKIKVYIYIYVLR